MKIFKTVVTLIDLDALGQRMVVDTIEHEGKLWLVPEWSSTLDGKSTKPTRIICLEGLPLQANTGDRTQAEFDLQCPMTKAILNGQAPPPPALSFVIV